MDAIWLDAATPTMGIIFFHGLGASADDLVGVSEPVSQALSDQSITWCFPQAPIQAVTINGGMQMPSWFDILSLDKEASEDEEGIGNATKIALKFIDAMVAKGVPQERIILCGFSQGGALVLSTLVAAKPKIGAVASFSGYLPKCVRKSGEGSSVPIRLMHGRRDDVVSFSYAKVAQNWLNDEGFHATLHAYNIDHSISMECLADFIAWLKEQF